MNPWLSRRRAVDAPTVRLYCLPHSGGSAGEYLRWADAMPKVEVWGVNLPGRGARLDEPPATTVAGLAEAIGREVPCAPPFVLFGHSLGGLLAYEVAQWLRAHGGEMPERLVLSGCAPPHLPRTAPRVSHLPDEQLLEQVARSYGGIPVEVLRDPDLRALVVPPLRADLAALERYAHPPHPPLPCPIVVLCGDRDGLTSLRLTEWDRHTTAGCRVRLLPGGHFYFREKPEAMMDVLADVLTEPSLR